jgi:hypothetical protein
LYPPLSLLTPPLPLSSSSSKHAQTHSLSPMYCHYPCTKFMVGGAAAKGALPAHLLALSQHLRSSHIPLGVENTPTLADVELCMHLPH